MGRQFSETEKNDIRKLLLAEGKELFASRGLKRTTVDDVTRRVGIAQGSFYAFFGSKEELYFEILEAEERELWTNLQSRLHSIQLNRKNFKEFLLQALDLIDGNPFIRDLVRNNSYQKLLTKIPEAKMKRHLAEETAILTGSIDSFQKEGLMKRIDPRVLAGLFHGLFLLHLHRGDIGDNLFGPVIELFVDVTSDGLVTVGDRNVE